MNGPLGSAEDDADKGAGVVMTVPSDKTGQAVTPAVVERTKRVAFCGGATLGSLRAWKPGAVRSKLRSMRLTEEKAGSLLKSTAVGIGGGTGTGTGTGTGAGAGGVGAGGAGAGGFSAWRAEVMLYWYRPLPTRRSMVILTLMFTIPSVSWKAV